MTSFQIILGVIYTIVVSAFVGLIVMSFLLNQWAYGLVLFLLILLCYPQINSLIRYKLLN